MEYLSLFFLLLLFFFFVPLLVGPVTTVSVHAVPTTPISMSSPISYYRSLYRRLGRLPLDTRSLGILKESVKLQFRTAKPIKTHSLVDRKSYDQLSTIADDILLRKQYRELATLLDYIHKQKWQSERWKQDFVHTKYSQWIPIWPQVHLLREFGTPKHIDAYDKELASMDPPQTFSVLKELDLSVSSHLKPLEPLHIEKGHSNLQYLLENLTKFHIFLQKHTKALMDVKLMPIEVVYEPSRKGLPLSVAAREKIFRSKITYMKTLCQEFRPLRPGSMDHLVLVATGSSGDFPINPVFFRYMKRTSLLVSPFERKYLVQKQLIPNDRNIRFQYRSYVVRQFSIDEVGAYKPCPMQNFYD